MTERKETLNPKPYTLGECQGSSRVRGFEGAFSVINEGCIDPVVHNETHGVDIPLGASDMVLCSTCVRRRPEP